MKNRKRILAAILTAIMTISILPANSFASEAGENDTAEAAVEAVSVSDEEQEVESTVEDISEETTEEKEEVSSETVEAEEEAGPAEEAEAVTEDVETAAEEDAEAEETFEDEIPEEEEAVPAETVEWPITLQAKSGTYNVTVTYGEDAGLPADAKVSVDEITASDRVYDDYVEQAADTISADVDDLAYAKLFDIKLIDADGNKLEPTGFVDVKIRLKDVGQVEESTQVVHFAGDAEVPEVLDTDVSGKDVSFETNGFSIYAVIGTGEYVRLTVKFYGAKNDSTGEYALLDTAYVKKADQSSTDSAEIIKAIINDPGVGEVPQNYAFYGWSIGNKDYSAEAGSTIQDVRDYVQTLEFSDGDVLEVYAMYVTHYTVKYTNREGVNLKSDTIMVTKAGVQVDYTVNMSYPSDDTHEFEGWMPVDHASNIADPAGATADTLFINGTPIKITGDVTFSVSAPEGHWLVFHENGKNATFNAARFVKAGEPTSAAGMLEMNRNGYVFDGWYLGAPSQVGGDPTGDRFEFGGEITETTDVYAKWIRNQNADYTVIIWKEGLEVGKYDFGEAITIKDATVGQPVAVSAQGSGDDAYAVINGVAYNGTNNAAYKGFHLRAQNPIVESNTTIGPEGNTVVNVYYDRTEYTLRFVLSIRIPFVGNWNAITYDTITARYGTYIGDQFPVRGSAFERWVRTVPLLGPYIGDYLTGFHRWDPQNSETLDKVIVYLETMPAENITFSRNDSITSRIDAYYYGEALPGETGTHEFEGRQWVQIGHSTARYNYFTLQEDFIDFTGFDKYKTDPEFDEEGKLDNRDRADFYYTRQRSKITYLNGWKYDGDNARIESIDGEIAQSEDIPFETNLSSYNKGQGNYFVPSTSPKGFVFEGWYVDKYCTQEYTFQTMPANGITVYAKWREIEYRVFLRPNAGTDSTLEWGSNDQKMTFRVAYGEKVSVPQGKRDGYTFLGWYYDEELTRPVYSANVVVDKSTATDAYDKTLPENMTDPMDKWGNGATSNADVNRFWITNRFELFGKWSKDPIGADGIRVVYDAGDDGTNPPSDTVLYQDNTTAVAGAAPKAKAGKVFVKWVVQKWDKVEKTFVDTEVERLPGQTFDVYLDNARIQEIQDDESLVDVDKAVSGHSYVYTIRVIAKYEDEEVKIPTHITWYKNDGTGDVLHDDTDIKINEAVPVYGLGEGEVPTRTGYTFLGWAKDVERMDAQEAVRTSSPKTTADFLEYRDGKFYVPGGDKEITEVAADEITPYEGLYAIWEKSFKIYHSATDKTETIRMSEFDGNITKKVTKGYLYGGYYEFEEDGDHKGKACTVSGLSMTPEAGTTYYLREVDPNYLKPSVYLIYSNYYNGKIQDLYGFVNVDDKDEYYDVGMFVNGTKMTVKDTLATQAIKINRGGALYATLDSSSLFGMSEATFGYKNLKDSIVGDTTVQIGGYYVTKDNVQVTGYRDRMIRFAANGEYGAPVFTGWYPNGNTKIGLKTVGTTNTAAVLTSARPLFASRMLTISAPSEKMEYTITKIYDNGTDEEVVEEGDYTGVISYASRSGYLFAGWYKDAAFTEPADFSAVSSDMTVYAKYVKNSDVSVAFTSKSLKSGTATLNATVTVKGQADFENVTVSTKGTSTSVLTGRTVKKTGSGKNVKYTTQYKGTATVKGVSLISSFTASVNWTTPDGTAVTGPAYNCNYILGLVTVN